MGTESGPRTLIALSRRSFNSTIVSALALLTTSKSYAQQDTETTVTVEDYVRIEQLLVRYALALDNRDSAAYADCYLPGVLTPAQFEKIMNFHRKYERTVHHVLNLSYTVQEELATGSHYSLVCYVKNTAGKLTKFDTYARYENVQLVKKDGRWLIGTLEWRPIFSTEAVPVVSGVPPHFWDGLK